MTWYYDRQDDGSIDIHEDDPEFTGLVETVSPDGRVYPKQEVKRVMRKTWEEQANLGSSPVMDIRAGYILMDMTTNNIKAGVP